MSSAVRWSGAGLLPGLGRVGCAAELPPPPTETVKAYQRRAPFTALATVPDEGGLRFAPAVPVEVIAVPNPEVAGLPPDAYEVMGEKVT